MADAQVLHQIEYRHHQTKDLSPIASSMSPDSLRAWDSRIRPWVRHPHADRLSESMCYQVFPKGQAAVAWRYWDQRAAERADGTSGRPLVSRVLVGQDSVLTPDVAVALCLVGLPDSVGLRPGQAPDGTPLSTVSGDALQAMTREKTAELDRDALRQVGLQAVVAAALADPATPLAINIRDVIVQKPLRESVQYPLLWGLRRIAGRLLGQAGRGWSFSTFEPPMGELDPASLPGIVFRQTGDGVAPPPTRWRKEIKVRPFARDALAPGLPYAGRIDLAGWLVAEYHKRGGDDLDRFIADRCGTERPVYLRIERVHEGLQPLESPVPLSEEAAAFVPVRLTRDRQPEPAPVQMPAVSRELAPSAVAESALTQPAEPALTESHLPENKAPITEEPIAGSGGIFISYRRDDSAYPAGWLFDKMNGRYSAHVFKDIDSIQPGDDFVAEITAAVESCTVLLAIIGKEWLTATDKAGRRRLDDPADFVRLEIEAALTRDVRVIPILVGGAWMPHADDLPPSLAKLTRRQALELSPHRFHTDTIRLFKVLDAELTSAIRAAAPSKHAEPRRDLSGR